MNRDQKLQQICVQLSQPLPGQIDLLASADHNIGYALIMFYGNDGKCHYNSNGEAAGMIRVLRSMADALEKKMPQEIPGQVLKLVPKEEKPKEKQ